MQIGILIQIRRSALASGPRYLATKSGSEQAFSVYWRTSSRPAGPGSFNSAARQSAAN